MSTPFAENEYQASTFKSLDLRNQHISLIEFDECKFTKCNFKDTTFRGIKFLKCVFQDCDFGMGKFNGCFFAETQFHKCQLIGINWTDLNLQKKQLLRPFDFSNCDLAHSTFIGLVLKRLTITRCVAHDIDFTDADLSQAVFRQTDFLGSRFHQTNLSGADFRGAVNYSISAVENNIKNARFSLPEAINLLNGLGIILENEPVDEQWQPS